MPKINVYLSDELAEAVRAANLPVSAICQRALEGSLQGAAAVREGTRWLDAPGGAGPLTRALTGRLRRAIDLAHDAAYRRSHTFVGTEHLVLGLLDEGGNLALQVMRALEVDPQDVRAEIEPLLESHQPAGGEPAPEPQRTPLASRALERAGNEAIRLGHNYVGCEHLLLGLVGEEEGLGGRVLRSMGLDPTVTRRAVVSALSGFIHATQGAPRQKVTPDPQGLDDVIARIERIEQRLAAG